MQGFDLDAVEHVAKREDEGNVIHLRDHVGALMYYMDGDDKKPVTITMAGTYGGIARGVHSQAKRPKRKPIISSPIVRSLGTGSSEKVS
jgi:hypothetical protein